MPPTDRLIGLRGVVLAVTLSALATAGGRAGELVRRDGFEIESLAPGIQVYRNVSKGPPGINSLVVERADGLLVIGAQATPEGASALLATLAKSGKKPVHYLVLTHPHATSCGGASAFPAGTLVVSSDLTRELLADSSYDVGAEERARASDPGTWIEPPRVLPVLHASAPLTLDDPEHRVVLYPIRQSHARGDLWAEIPGTGIVAVGGLVTGDRNPYARDGNVHNWIGALNELARDGLTAIVPDSGRVLSVADVRAMRDALAWARQRVQQAFIDLVPREEVVARVLADPELPSRLDVRASPSFARIVVERVFEETLEDRRRRGMP